MYKFACPECGAEELHESGKMVHIRVNKVSINSVWSSHCLVCSGGYDKIDGEFTEANHDPTKGWFVTSEGVSND